jgi:hypothetical protein
MRGEGTCAAVSRSTAEFRACFNCTTLFHHGDTETRRKTDKEKTEEPYQSFAYHCPANDQRQATNDGFTPRSSFPASSSRPDNA